MNQSFKDRVASRFERLEPAAMQKFLRMLKFDQNKLMLLISSNLEAWYLDFMIETDPLLVPDEPLDPREILNDLTKRFAQELEAITQ